MPSVYASVYLHGWDVVDEGVDDVLSRIDSFGFNAVNLAVSYHSGRYILPHNPRQRVYFAEEGVVYFEPHNENYMNTILKPQRSEKYAGVDILKSIVERAKDYNMKINAWTICNHNSSFVKQHPEVGILDPYLHTDYNWMCPNNPDVRNYVLGLIRDLASNYDLNMIMLESPVFPWGIVHGDHHEALEVYIEPMVSHLYSTCFCNYCGSKAKELGFNLGKIREKIKRIIEESLRIPSYILTCIPREYSFDNFHGITSEIEEVQDLIKYKFDVGKEVIEEVKNTIDEVNPRVDLSVITGPESRVQEGISYASVDNVVDAINLMVYYSKPECVYYQIKWAKELVRSSKVYASLRINYPVAYSPAIIEGEISAAMKAGADGLDFYNYGRAPLENLEWAGEGIRKMG